MIWNFLLSGSIDCCVSSEPCLCCNTVWFRTLYCILLLQLCLLMYCSVPMILWFSCFYFCNWLLTSLCCGWGSYLAFTVLWPCAQSGCRLSWAVLEKQRVCALLASVLFTVGVAGYLRFLSCIQLYLVLKVEYESLILIVQLFLVFRILKHILVTCF